MSATKVYAQNTSGNGGGFVDISTITAGQTNALGIDTSTRDAITIPAGTIPIIYNTDTSTFQTKYGGAWYDLSTKQYVDSLVVGLWDDRGNYDASVGTYPATGGSGTAGAIKKGDIWTVSVAGNIVSAGISHVVAVGDTVRALADTPGQTNSNWAIAEANFGYTAENQANKATDFTVLNNTLYATVLAINNQITARRNENGILYNQVTDVGTAADLLETTLKTYTLLGGTLATDYSCVEVESGLKTAANANVKTIKIYFGAMVIAVLDAVALNAKNIFIKAKIYRTAAGGQRCTCEVLVGSTAGMDATNSTIRFTDATETLSGDVVIKVTGMNGVATANDIIARTLVVKNNVLTA